MIYAIIQELRRDNSSNYKLQVLEKHKDNELWKNYLLHVYNPNYNYYISKLPSYGFNDVTLTLEDTIKTILPKYKTGSVRGNSGINLLTETLSSLPEDDAECLKLLIGRDIKCGINTSSINKVYGGLIPTTPYLGCIPYSEKSVKKIFDDHGYAISEVKSDGLYVNTILEGTGDEAQINFITRQGKPLYLLGGKLLSELKSIQQSGNSDLVFNGELVVQGVSRLASNGIVSRLKTINEALIDGNEKKAMSSMKTLQKTYGMTYEEAQDAVTLVTWDLVSLGDYNKARCETGRETRLKGLEQFLGTFGFNNIKLVEYKIVNSFEEAISDFKEKLERGEEGTVVKSPVAIWRHGKKEPQYKMKILLEIEMRIIGFNEGRKGTKYEGTTGSLLCQSECGKVTVSVGGITEKGGDVTRDEFWNDKEKYLNGVITMKCNGLSVNQSGNYNFFFPAYEKWRFDKNEANTLEEIIEIEQSALGLSSC